MLQEVSAVAGLAIVTAFYAEKRMNQRARKRLRHVVHVNGTRGKSTVCRLIDAGLRAGGWRVMTKTTGTAARLLHVDGTETPVIRRGNPSIREQGEVLRRAVREEAQVLVVECMAIKPELQHVSQRDLLMADIGVMTNVRHDHVHEMGGSLQKAAEAMASVIPWNGAFFAGDIDGYPCFQQICSRRNTHFQQANHVERQRTAPCEEEDALAGEMMENVDLALSVCHHLGVPPAAALKGMRQYRKDPGAFTTEIRRNQKGAALRIFNMLAVNDPDSMSRLLEHHGLNEFFENQPGIFILTGRQDRVQRLQNLLEWTVDKEHLIHELWVEGHGSWLVQRLHRRAGGVPGKLNVITGFNRLNQIMDNCSIVCFGNTCGSGEKLTRSIEGMEKIHE